MAVQSGRTMVLATARAGREGAAAAFRRWLCAEATAERDGLSGRRILTDNLAEFDALVINVLDFAKHQVLRCDKPFRVRQHHSDEVRHRHGFVRLFHADDEVHRGRSGHFDSGGRNLADDHAFLHTGVDNLFDAAEV